MKIKFAFMPLAIALAAVGFVSCGGEKDVRPDFVKENMELVWADEFNGESDEPNSDNWDYDTGNNGNGWGNGERQYYTAERTHSYVSKGTLKIVAKKNDKDRWESARLKTRFKQSFKYGYIEFRAKLPVESGSWPALWMMPQLATY
ncbi:MAG: glycoside hydrolase family 16 protein, partial [Treponema sp.]|nr:glycoside hydrolase family 16 protein [Treponema sp.]